MKKAIAIVVAILAAGTSFGQHEMGFKAGYNYLFTNYQESKSDIETDGGGYHVGAYYGFTPMDNLFISGELLISSRRWNEISSSSYDGSIQTKQETYSFYSNHYLEIPLSVKYGFNFRKGRYGDSKYLLFYAGPTMSLLMGTRGSTQETFRIDAQGQTTVNQTNTVFKHEDLKNYFAPFQMGIHAGVSYSFPFGLKIDARYQTMLMPTNKEKVSGVNIGEGNGLIKQGMVMFSIGYSFLRD